MFENCNSPGNVGCAQQGAHTFRLIHGEYQSLCQVTTPYQWDPFHFQNLPFGIMNLQTSTFSRSFPSGPVCSPPIQGTNQSFCCCCRSSEELTDEQHRAGGEGKAASSLNCCLFIEGSRRNLRNDLLVAADSITNTMSSLVKELNSGAFWGPVPCGFVVEGCLCSGSLLETCS